MMINTITTIARRPLKLTTITLLCFAALTSSAHAAFADDDFGLDINLGIKKKITKSLTASLKGNLRTQDKTTEIDRFSVNAALAYKPVKYLKLDAGYEFIDRYKPSYITDNNNTVDSYWSPRHRATASVSGILHAGDCVISLRERYQYTYRQETRAAKTSSTGDAISDKIIAAEHSHIWRQRVSFEYKNPDLRIAPYAEFELFNDLTDSFSLDKMRLTVGTGYHITKNHILDFYYRHTYDSAHHGEDNSHLIGIGYEFSF